MLKIPDATDLADDLAIVIVIINVAGNAILMLVRYTFSPWNFIGLKAAWI